MVSLVEASLLQKGTREQNLLNNIRKGIDAILESSKKLPPKKLISWMRNIKNWTWKGTTRRMKKKERRLFLEFLWLIPPEVGLRKLLSELINIFWSKLRLWKT